MYHDERPVESDRNCLSCDVPIGRGRFCGPCRIEEELENAWYRDEGGEG